jgi:hypothetical protein
VQSLKPSVRPNSGTAGSNRADPGDGGLLSNSTREPRHDDLVFVAVLGQLMIKLVLLCAGALTIGSIILIVATLLAPDPTDEAPQ